jgi:general secretion pathway protein D
LCPASPGGFHIFRTFPLSARGFAASRVVLFAALLLSACASPLHPNAPEAPPASLLDQLPPEQQQRAARALTALPRDADDAAAMPVIVRGAGGPTPAGATAPAAANEPADITLNFSGADIRDVIGSVLGNTLKLNYVVDPEVTGPITFNVSRPLRRSEVLSTLEAVLESRGFALVRSDGIIRIMVRPGDGKARIAVPVAGAIGERLEVFPVRYVAVGDIANILAKVLPPSVAVVPDERRRVLIVRGNSDELRTVEDTVRIFDIDELNNTSVALLPLANADAATVVGELQSIFATQREPDANVIRFIPVDRLNAVMVLTREGRLLDQARAWTERLDRTRNMNEQRVYVYYLQYGKAAQVAETLQGALSSIDIEVKGAAVPATDGLAAGRIGSEVPPVAPGFPTPPPLVPAPAPGAPAAPAAAAPQQTKPSVRIEADQAHNALLVSASARDYQLIHQVLEEIDKPPFQVLIEVTIAEVTLNDNLRYGVQYFVNSRGNSGGNVSTLLTQGITSAGITPAVPGFSLAFTGANLAPRVVLDALSDLTQTKVISTPRLMVLDNQVARLQVGDVVPIITQSAASTISASPLVLSNVQYKETGVVLEVTPRVNSSGYVTLDISQSVSSVVPTTTSGIDSPTFSQRRLTSTISVKSGNSVLLGGLIQSQDNREASGIPLLHTIPILGALFGDRNNTTARTELIMFMTPYVLSNDEQTNDVTRRVQQQFRAVLDRSTLVSPRPVPR